MNFLGYVFERSTYEDIHVHVVLMVVKEPWKEPAETGQQTQGTRFTCSSLVFW